jgi:subtilisin-like proprotein convertase family protein
MQVPDLAPRRAARPYVLGALVLAAACLALLLLSGARGGPPRAPLAAGLALEEQPQAPQPASTTQARKPGSSVRRPLEHSLASVPASALARPGCVLYPGEPGPHLIPDNDPQGLTTTLTVPPPGPPLASIGVRIESLRHAYVGDLRLQLIAPDGTSLVLVDQVGNDSDDFYRTAFHDSATTPVHRGLGPFTGAFRPDQALAPLTALPASGSWQLNVSDLASGDEGALLAWSLELCPAAALAPPPTNSD